MKKQETSKKPSRDKKPYDWFLPKQMLLSTENDVGW